LTSSRTSTKLVQVAVSRGVGILFTLSRAEGPMRTRGVSPLVPFAVSRGMGILPMRTRGVPPLALLLPECRGDDENRKKTP
jgi:hypothetical protein